MDPDLIICLILRIHVDKKEIFLAAPTSVRTRYGSKKSRLKRSFLIRPHLCRVVLSNVPHTMSLRFASVDFILQSLSSKSQDRKLKGKSMKQVEQMFEAEVSLSASLLLSTLLMSTSLLFIVVIVFDLFSSQKLSDDQKIIIIS